MPAREHSPSAFRKRGGRRVARGMLTLPPGSTFARAISSSHFAHRAFPQGRVGPSIGPGLKSDEHGAWA